VGAVALVAVVPELVATPAAATNTANPRWAQEADTSAAAAA